MQFLRRNLKYLFLLLLVVLFIACSSQRKNPYYSKRVKASKENTNRLGRNKYYFSDTYHKKLTKSVKRR